MAMQMAGGRGALKERRDDLNETPACAIEALVAHETMLQRHIPIWECAAGKGAIARVLLKHGFLVEMTDLCGHDGADKGIRSGVDFLMERHPPTPHMRIIVTNPPYKLTDEFIDHGLNMGCYVIVLLRFMYAEGVDGRIRGSGLRSKLVDNHLERVWLGRERLPMMHRDGWEGKKIDASGVPHAWFVFSPVDHRADRGFIVNRISWRL